MTAQEEWNGGGLKFSFETLLRNQIVLPPSPEAASLGKYCNIPVSHFTGAPQVQLPIYTLGGHYLSWSVSLSYDVHGVKVNEVPSRAGLGWTLNASGIITRSVIGDPDVDGARWYDPTTGRFSSIDRFSDKFAMQSPYVHAVNNPIFFIDVNGDRINCPWLEHSSLLARQAA